MLDINKVYESSRYGKFYISNYINSRKILIKFEETGYETYVQCGQILYNRVKDRLSNRDKTIPSIENIGFEGIGKYNYEKDFKASVAFRSLMQRGYNLKFKNRQKNYIGVSVCKYWHNFQNFCEWFYKNYKDGYYLDKDLYIELNKESGPLTCTYVPKWVNEVFQDHSSRKNKNLLSCVGIKPSGYYFAYCKINGKNIYGTIKITKEEARIDYLKMKINYMLNDIMIRKDFPNRLIWSFWLRVENMKSEIKMLQSKIGEL